MHGFGDEEITKYQEAYKAYSFNCAKIVCYIRIIVIQELNI